MKRVVWTAGVLALLIGWTPLQAHTVAQEFIVIAHRGASGERPEHTLAAYERAIDQGADYIEPDLVVTRDGVLVARHENELSDSTDIAARDEFADRRRTKTVDGQLVAGWFAEDFTLAELRSLRAVERLPDLRPQNALFDRLYQVPTLAEIVHLVRAKEAELKREIGLYPELKHPGFLLQAEGIDVVDLLLAELDGLGFTANDRLYIQSFEPGTLRRLDQRSSYRLVQLLAASGGPADEPTLSFAAMASPSGLLEVATYADAVGVDLRLLLNADGTSTGLIAAAHAVALPVHAWTLRKENAFLPPGLREGDGDADAGRWQALLAMLEQAGVDGVFTDHPGPVISSLRGGQ